MQAGVAGGAFYVGALGSRRTQEKRRAALGDEVADRVRGPVGLKLGGETPAEIALEIVAEILAVTKSVPASAPDVPAYAALLRGINVGGKNKVADAAAAGAVRGARPLRTSSTYVQSGNVVFRAPRATAGPIERRIEEVFGLELAVVLRTGAGARCGRVAGNPFLVQGAETKPLHVVFLDRKPAAGRSTARSGPLARRPLQR